jgi:hypothetical protein
MYDLVIVGAGPRATLARLSRAACARCSSTGERRPPGPAGAKCCGRLLAPRRSARRARPRRPREALVGPSSSRCAPSTSRRLERHYPRHYLNVDQGRFDAWLRSLSRRSALPGAASPPCGEGDAMAVALESPGGTEVVRARLSSARTGPPPRALSLPGFQARHLPRDPEVPGARRRPCYTAVFDPRATDFTAGRSRAIGRGRRRAAPAQRPVTRLVGRSRIIAPPRPLARREGAMLHRPRASPPVAGRGRVALVGRQPAS